MIVEIKKNTPTLYVYWTITDFCNFSCSYCPDKLHSGDFAKGRKQGFPSDEEINVFLDRLVNVHLKGRFLQVCLSGGEPTLHPMYGEIIHKLKPFGLIETVTNGSRALAWWKELPSLPDKVTMSLHPGFTKIDRVNSLGEYLLDHNVDVVFNMMCDPEQWPEVEKLYNQLTDRLKRRVNGKILTDHSGGIDDGKPYDYEQEQLDYIKSKAVGKSDIINRFANVDKRVFVTTMSGEKTQLLHPFELVNTNQHRMQGWSCSAGSDGIAVDYNGYAYAGNCRIKQLGRLDKFELLPERLVCTRQFCKTAVDLQLDKCLPTLSQDL